MTPDYAHEWKATGAFTTHDGEHIVCYDCLRCLTKEKRDVLGGALPLGPCELVEAIKPTFWVEQSTWRDGLLEVTLMGRVDVDIAGRQYMNRLLRHHHAGSAGLTIEEVPND